MKSPEEILSLYDTVLKEAIRPLEKRRKRLALGGLLGFTGWLGVVVPSFLWLPEGAAFAIAAVAAGAGLWSWSGVRSRFAAEFKEKVVRRVVAFCDPQLTYQPQDMIGLDTFQASGLFQQRVDRYRGDDLVEGRLGATAIRFSEVHAEHKTETRDSRGRRRTHWSTIFRGLFIVADFNKHFRTRTVVLPDLAERLMGGLGKTLQSWNALQQGELIKLEDPEFEQEFVVYGDDAVEARYVLSPALMRRIMEFKRKSGNRTYVSFVESMVCVAIAMKRPLFEPRIFRSLLSPAPVQEYVRDLQLAAGLVEDLNLNTRIWTKS